MVSSLAVALKVALILFLNGPTMVTTTRMKLALNALTSTNSIKIQQHQAQLQSWPAATLCSCLQSSNTKPSCNPDQLQHYDAAFNPAAPSPAAKLPCYTQPSSTKSSCNITSLPSIQQYLLQQSTISCCLIYKGLQANSLLLHALAIQAHAFGGLNVDDCFFDSSGITSLATHAIPIYYWFFG